jgi:ParB-like chromosome segregation protein Spo0J
LGAGVQEDVMLSIIMLPVASLKPNARNARKHSEKQIQQTAGSITAFGFTNPVLVDEKNTVIAGIVDWKRRNA